MMREEMLKIYLQGRLNADWLDLDAANAPDGDADLEVRDFTCVFDTHVPAVRRTAQARRRVLR